MMVKDPTYGGKKDPSKSEIRFMVPNELKTIAQHIADDLGITLGDYLRTMTETAVDADISRVLFTELKQDQEGC